MHEGHRKRMLDKLFNHKEILSDHEILEILLFYAIPRKNVNEIAHNLLDAFGDLEQCLSADKEAYLTIDGVGENTAGFLMTIGEVFKRSKEKLNKLPVIFSYDSSKKMLIESFKNFQEEKFMALFLDKNGLVIFRKIFSSHSDRHVDVKIDKLLKGTLVKKPASVVICHNHLSGKCNPSLADDKATEKIYLSLRLQNIRLADHIIVSGENTFSYRSSGRLDNIAKNLDLILY